MKGSILEEDLSGSIPKGGMELIDKRLYLTFQSQYIMNLIPQPATTNTMYYN